MSTVTAVISDLHVGAGPLDDCDEELEGRLVEFIRERAVGTRSVELVINGDFLDCAQAPPWTGNELEGVSEYSVNLCFTEEQSLSKLKAIIMAHPAIFEAFSLFLASQQDNRIVILPGNHDVDFFWPAVRDGFTRTLDGAVRDRLVFHLERVYHPSGCTDVWIEHGHQYDPINSFFIGDTEYWSVARPPILDGVDGCPRLYECIGTRFLNKYLNHLDANYPFVDNVKPFWRFLQLFGTSALTPGLGSLKAAVAVGEMFAFLASSLALRPEDVLELDPGQPATATHLLLRAYNGAIPDKRRAFIEALAQCGFTVDRSLDLLLADPEISRRLLGFLADHLELLDLLDQSENEQTLALGKGFVVNETDELRTNATRILTDSAKATRAVIMGHTHETVNQRAPCYINTGSWTRYYQFARQERLHSWSILRSRSYERFPYELNFALIEPGATPVAQLITFDRKDKDANA